MEPIQFQRVFVNDDEYLLALSLLTEKTLSGICTSNSILI